MRADDFIRSVNNEPLTWPEISGNVTREYLGFCKVAGYDPEDPEALSGFVKRLMKKLKKRIRARRKKGGKRKRKYSITTPEGTATLSPKGLSFIREAPKKPFFPMLTAPGGAGAIGELFKNPMMLMIPGAIILMLMMKKKQPGSN